MREPLLARWGRLLVRRRWIVLGVWLAVIAGGLALTPAFLDRVEGVGLEAPGTESDRARQALEERGVAPERAPLVISGGRVEDLNADFDAAVKEIVASARGVEHVQRVIPPGRAAVNEAGDTAVATLLLTGSDAERQKAAEEVQKRVDAAAADGVRADVTGPSAIFATLIRVEEEDLIKAEAVGLPVAALILVLAFGTLVAAGLPLLVAIAGLTVTFGTLGLISVLAGGFSIFIENIVVMVGLGVGIDYALLIVRRFREERGAGDGDTEALARTTATAGRTVIFSGATVVVTMAPLAVVGVPFFAEIAIGAALVLAVMVFAALTLVPALLAVLGDRIERLRVPVPKPSGGNGWIRWTGFVMRRPWPVLIAALIVLGLMAAPALQITTGIDFGIRAFAGEPVARGTDELAKEFPALAAEPVSVVLVARQPGSLVAAERRVTATLRAEKRLARVQSQRLGADAAVIYAGLTVPPDTPEAAAVVRSARSSLAAGLPPGVTASVGGISATSEDFSTQIEDAVPFAVTGALLLCFFVLLFVFRSPFLALKAVLANLLSIAASLGLIVLIFQDGHGEGLLGFTSPGYLQTYIPLTVFVLTYGLSMDYEVFIVTRIREEWERNGGDNEAAIAVGLQRTGGVVTSAAAIMVAVFLSFSLARVPEIKQFGFGLAAAIAIDATIVRAALVPAAMRIAGRLNWWEPKLLSRLRWRTSL